MLIFEKDQGEGDILYGFRSASLELVSVDCTGLYRWNRGPL